MSVVLQTGVMYYRESQSDDWHPLILKVDTDLSALIEDYSQKAWELGEYCRYDSAVYRCTTAITTPEVWDSTHWQETTIGEELKNIIDITGDGDLDSGFTASDLTGAANELKTDIGDLEDITGDGSLSGFTATDLTGAANELKDTLNQLDGRVDSTQSTEAYVLGAVTAGVSISGSGVYVIYNDDLYTTTQSIASTDSAPYTGKITPVSGGGGFNSLKTQITALANRLYVSDETYLMANGSKTYTLASISEIGFLFANAGDGTQRAWVVGARNNNEIGVNPITAESAYFSISKSGLSFTITCTYASRIIFVCGAH